ncbi:MAG: CheR family methyltransferase, partial [Pricia sp.]
MTKESTEKDQKSTGQTGKGKGKARTQTKNTQNKTGKAQRADDLFIVGVGASAGGLDAISKFLSSFNGIDVDCSVVIVMHLSPDYKSELTSILGKRCKWPVVTAENNMYMEARHIYVTPQNSNIHVEHTKLVLEPLPQKYSSAPSIDNFLTTLAQSKSRKAVGIILSGFGSDGSEGIKAIKRHNGLTIAQLPETAEHKDMPKSAIKTDDIDLTLPAERMYEEIKQYISNSNTIAQSPPKKKSMDAIFELLEKRSGTDFSQYKPNTIMRRISYRMTNLKLNSLVDYYEMIKNSPRELDVLFETVLIGVTEFFRDTEAYDGLKKHLEILLEDKNPGDSIRIWSVGCATGEEPYSVGILLHELLGTAINQHQIQIFASDIDEKALNFGRKGVYKKESLENIPSELKSRYFEKRKDDHFEISKEIKQHTLFARHDITHDPPFVKLDLIVCRNLLIYFNNELQKQAFQIFHYSLRPKGLLFLGKSESVGVAGELFTKHDKHKIFRKADAALNYQLRFSRFKNHKSHKDTNGSQHKTRNMGIVDVAKETLYYKFEHPFVIVNGHAEIKEVHGSLRLYLEISQGTMNANLYKMANPELVTVLKAQMAQVKKTGVPHLSHSVKFELYDSDRFVKVRIAPLIYTVGEEQFYMVIFQKVEPGEKMLDLQKKLETEDFVDLRIKELEEELESTKEHLQIFTEELEATNEELQSINEELQSANEELKSSNEELETSNEELQSANEELNTANHEMRLANEALVAKEKELQAEKTVSERNELIYRTIAENIPNGSVGILNQDFKIEYVAGKIFENSVLQAEEMIGRSMPNIHPSKKEAERLRKLCQATLKGKSGQIEVFYEGRYYEVQTVPITISEDEGTKILYLAQEITELRENQMKLESALEATNLIVFEYDYAKDRIAPNKALNRLFEIRGNKIVSETDMVEKVHPEDVKKRAKKMKKAR